MIKKRGERRRRRRRRKAEEVKEMARLTRDTLQLGVFFALAGGTAAALLLTSMAKKAAKVEFEQMKLAKEDGGKEGDIEV